MNSIKILKILMIIYQIFGLLGELLTVVLTPDNLIKIDEKTKEISENDLKNHREASLNIASTLNNHIKTAIMAHNVHHEKILPTPILQPPQPLNVHVQGKLYPSLIDSNSPPPKRIKRIIVSIDGGGMRGIVTLKLLQELEKCVGVDIISKASLLGGTSTGSIIAFGRTKGLPYQEIIEIYRGFGRCIFKGALKNFIVGATLANSDKKKAELRNVFGDQPLSDFARDSDKKIFAVVSRLRNTSDQQFEPKKFTNYTIKHEKVTVTEAIDCSSAAPLYFKPVDVQGRKYVDGGILQNNPILIAHREAMKLYSEDSDFIFISLGTGFYQGDYQIPLEIDTTTTTTTTSSSSSTSKIASKLETFKASVNSSFQNSPGAKLQETLKSTVGLIKTAGASIADTETAHQIFKQLCKSYKNISYYRFNPIITQNYTLADYSKQSIKAMQDDAVNFITNADVFKDIENLRMEIESMNK